MRTTEDGECAAKSFISYSSNVNYITCRHKFIELQIKWLCLHKLLKCAEELQSVLPSRLLCFHYALVLNRILSRELVLGPEAVVDETEQTPGAELRERDALLSLLDRHIRVRDCCRREKYEGASRELDDELHVPQNQVAACLGIEISKRLHRAPAEREIADIAMLESPHIRPKVKSGAGEDRARERTLEFWEVLAQAVLAQGSVVVDI